MTNTDFTILMLAFVFFFFVIIFLGRLLAKFAPIVFGYVSSGKYRRMSWRRYRKFS